MKSNIQKSYLKGKPPESVIVALRFREFWKKYRKNDAPVEAEKMTRKKTVQVPLEELTKIRDDIEEALNQIREAKEKR